MIRRQGRQFLGMWRHGSLPEQDEDETIFHTLPMTEWSSMSAYIAELEAHRDAHLSAITRADAEELRSLPADKLVGLILGLQADNKKLETRLASVTVVRPEDNPGGQPQP